jgi:hypothetical protein
VWRRVAPNGHCGGDHIAQDARIGGRLADDVHPLRNTEEEAGERTSVGFGIELALSLSVLQEAVNRRLLPADALGDLACDFVSYTRVVWVSLNLSFELTGERPAHNRRPRGHHSVS